MKRIILLRLLLPIAALAQEIELPLSYPYTYDYDITAGDNRLMIQSYSPMQHQAYFQGIDTAGVQIINCAIPFKSFDVLTTSFHGDQFVCYLARENKKDIAVDVLVIDSEGKNDIIEEVLLIDSSKEKIISSSQADGKDYLMTVGEEGKQMKVYWLNKETIPEHQIYNIQSDRLAEAIFKDGIQPFTNKTKIPTPVKSYGSNKLYQHAGYWYFTSDVASQNGYHYSLVERVPVIGGKSESLVCRTQTSPFSQQSSFIVEDMLYKAAVDRKGFTIYSFSLREEAKLKDSVMFLPKQPFENKAMFTEKYLKKKILDITLLSHYNKKVTRQYAIGQPTVLVNILQDSTLVVHAGTFYRDEVGLFGGPDLFTGMIVLVVTTAVKQASVNGIQRYFSICLDQHLRSKPYQEDEVSEADRITADLLNEHKKLSYVHYAHFAGRSYVVYRPRKKPILRLHPY